MLFLINFKWVKKMRKFCLTLVLCLTLSGCQTLDNLHMPDVKMPSMSMPDMSRFTSLFSFGTKEDAKTPSENPVITEPTIDMSLPPVQCQIFEGSAHIKDDWYNYAPAAFVIRRNETTSASLMRKWGDGEVELQVRYDEDGQRLVFCPMHLFQLQDKIECASIFALQDDFKFGIRRTLDVADTLRGGMIECKQAAVAPPAVKSDIN